MIPKLAHFIHRTLKSSPKPRAPASLKDLQSIRSLLLRTVEDCKSPPAERLRFKITNTKTPQDLWMLRNDAYQIISQQHNQAIAAQRINGLMHCFDGWLDPRQLVRIK